MMRFRWFLICFTAALFAATFVAVTPATASDNGAWSVFPTPAGKTDVPGPLARPYFTPLLRPGVRYRDHVRVTNKTDRRLTFNLYAADAFNTSDGAFGLHRRTDPKRDVAKWTKLQVNRVTLPPHSQVDIAFNITPPRNAQPGDHPGGVVAEQTTGLPSRHGQVGVSVIQAVGTRLYARVAGPLHPALSVVSLSVAADSAVASRLMSPAEGEIHFLVKNTGNVRLSPTQRVTISPLFGSAKTLSTVRLPELLPGGSVTVTEPFAGVRSFGRYSAHVVVEAPNMKATSATSAITPPWLLFAAVAILAVGAVLWRVRARVRVRRSVPPAQRAPAQV